MNITQKSAEQLQAQAEEFANIGVGEFSSNQFKLLKNAEILSSLDQQSTLKNPPGNLPTEVYSLLHNYASRASDLLWEKSDFQRPLYTQSLQKAKRENIKEREKYINIYKTEFKEIIDALKKEIHQKGKNHDKFLGNGMNGNAYIFEGKDGKKYVAKMSQSINQANFELAPLLQSRGIKNTSQLRAYWAPEGIAIMDFIPGKDISQTEFGTQNYTREQMKNLIQTVIDLDENGLIIDPNPSNIIYDKKDGFSVIDSHIKDEELDVSLSEILLWLEVSIRDFSYRSTNQEGIRIDNETPIESHKRYLENMVQFLELIEKNSSGRIQSFYEQQRIQKQKLPWLKQPKIIHKKEYLETIPELAPYFDRLRTLGVE